jgi:hypothetical protein
MTLIEAGKVSTVIVKDMSPGGVIIWRLANSRKLYSLRIMCG